eukprot:TRINITY_DN5839_c0_g1_i1.p1 TRINITY_DN5839_c0_g1~~TRINITY_DN5839_c0_g1_i1.p1  ORF type:complete len:118 (-),score=20.84 TRINITY_DN5839_c0_g1_i1:9-362(-)
MCIRDRLRDEKKVGFANLTLTHFPSAPRESRGFVGRVKIIIEEDYDPTRDLYYDNDRVLQLKPPKRRLIQKLGDYFSRRREDERVQPQLNVNVKTVEELLRDVELLKAETKQKTARR